MLRYLLLLLTFPTIALANYQACPLSDAANTPNFCASFKTSAICHCKEKAPAFLCRHVKSIYSRMIFYYGSLEDACRDQKSVDPATCMEEWKCYMNGGKDNTGKLCATTGLACE